VPKFKQAYLKTTVTKKYFIHKEREQIKFEECLLPYRSVSLGLHGCYGKFEK
jgi:hypothetical protein